MKFGFCARLTDAAIVAAGGCDYIEPGVFSDLRPLDLDDKSFEALRNDFAASGLKAKTFNLLVPASLRITGPTREAAALDDYMTIAVERARAVGARVLVFGSAGARRYDDDGSYEQAWVDIRDFLIRTAPIAAGAGLTIAIESLASAECNILTSVAECVRMAEQVNCPDAVGVLSDLYHVNADGQSYDETADAGKWLRHVHVACGANRHSPVESDYDDLIPYFAAIKRAGYDARISVEAHITDLAGSIEAALPVLRRAWADA